jgi:RHS repeat-associated protein
MKTYGYDAFVNETGINASDANPFRYAGEYYDKETGDYYLRARNYDPVLGRMNSEDSVRMLTLKMPNGQEIMDPQSLNLYAYCQNNPIMYVDENGHWIHIAIGALVGGTIGGVICVVSQAAQAGGDLSQIDMTKVLISTATGAASGALASTGFGLLWQMGGNAILGGASNAVDQTYEMM